MTFSEAVKVGDPLLNANGEVVAEVMAVREDIVSFRMTGGHPWQDPVRVLCTLPDGSTQEFEVPQTMAAEAR